MEMTSHAGTTICALHKLVAFQLQAVPGDRLAAIFGSHFYSLFGDSSWWSAWQCTASAAGLPQTQRWVLLESMHQHHLPIVGT
jgi:hypothetical protein